MANSMGCNTEILSIVKYAQFGGANAGDNQIMAAVTNKKIRCVGYAMVADAAEVVQFQDDAGNNLSGTISLAANGGVVHSAPSNVGVFQSVMSQGIDINNVGGADVDGHMAYIEV